METWKLHVYQPIWWNKADQQKLSQQGFSPSDGEAKKKKLGIFGKLSDFLFQPEEVKDKGGQEGLKHGVLHSTRIEFRRRGTDLSLVLFFLVRMYLCLKKLRKNTTIYSRFHRLSFSVVRKLK